LNGYHGIVPNITTHASLQKLQVKIKKQKALYAPPPPRSRRFLGFALPDIMATHNDETRFKNFFFLPPLPHDLLLLFLLPVHFDECVLFSTVLFVL
jgi:hypothetical protein